MLSNFAKYAIHQQDYRYLVTSRNLVMRPTPVTLTFVGRSRNRGTRIVREDTADGMTREEILKAHPDLKAKDVEEALRYAADAVGERELQLRSAS